MTHTGSCHCGQVRFEIDGEIENVIDCNCSICARKGALLWGTSAKNFRLLTPEAVLGTYRFNTEAIGHQFCTVCGMHPFARGLDRSGNDFVMVNVRCLDNVDSASLTVQHFDGRAL